MAFGRIIMPVDAFISSSQGIIGWESAELVYSLAEPIAVTLVFRGGARWTFARSLLVDGLEAGSGEGVIRIWPDEVQKGEPLVRIQRRWQNKSDMVTLNRDVVETFLNTTLQTCPNGQEISEIVLDQELKKLLQNPAN